jgi:hypothetical protein
MPVPEDAKPEEPEKKQEESPEGPGEGQDESARTETGAEEPEAEAGEEGAAAEQELEPLDVYALLRVMVGQLSAAAWQKMGLQPDPFTNALHRDTEQARVAIDCVALIAEKLLPQLHGQEERDLQSMLTDLRLNFVRQSEGESSSN